MDYQERIAVSIDHLKRLGYTDRDVAEVVAHYTGYHAWLGLSRNQQRRLAEDLNRHVRIARKWHYLLNGWVQ